MRVLLIAVGRFALRAPEIVLLLAFLLLAWLFSPNNL